MKKMGENVELLNEQKRQRRQSIRVEDFFDIYSIPREDLMSIVNDMRAFLPNKFGGNLLWNGKKLIAEKEVLTLPFEKVKEELLKLGWLPWQIKSDVYANGIEVIILYADVAKNTQVISAEMESLGWSTACISKPVTRYGAKFRVIDFDPIEQDSAKEKARMYNYLYHWTPFSNVESILKNGIEPRNQNDRFSYPPKAHLLKGDITKKFASEFGWELFNKNKGNKDGHYALIRITMRLIPETIDFFEDPRFDYGFFSKETIPSKSLDIFGEIIYKDKYNYNKEPISVLAENDTMV